MKQSLNEEFDKVIQGASEKASRQKLALEAVTAFLDMIEKALGDEGGSAASSELINSFKTGMLKCVELSSAEPSQISQKIITFLDTIEQLLEAEDTVNALEGIRAFQTVITDNLEALQPVSIVGQASDTSFFLNKKSRIR